LFGKRNKVPPSAVFHHESDGNAVSQAHRESDG
jgi:hypothetical protein